MGYKRISIVIPTGYEDDRLRKKIERLLLIKDFTYSIESKSLDARKKNNIHWEMRILVSSDEYSDDLNVSKPELEIPYKKRNKNVVVVGSGPAGFFAATILQQAGFNTTLIERGTDVKKRTEGIEVFEATGIFNPVSNYAMGEGGAGTFSDGKLTSRSSRISIEKKFILASYVNAGAPDEIQYMTHPHLGSDNLKIIVENLRKQFVNIGGTVLFETTMIDLKVENNKVSHIETNKGNIDSDYFLVAPGHSSYDTYRMLMKRSVGFHTKNFALGSRMEHHQEIINMAQWGRKSISGVKAAEYRLTSKGDGKQQVYSFCMCPGGVIVPAMAVEQANIVNGMSKYLRNEKFANAACVATINLGDLLKREVLAEETLDWMENLERSFYEFSLGYKAPMCSIRDFINKKVTNTVSETSYPLGIIQAPLWELLPDNVEKAIREGLKDFIRKMKGFETGNIMGLESKTSAPIQVERENDGRCSGFENLYVIGEGSGYSGGIISSAADGVKAAMTIISGEYS
ncbi:MAG: FAD-dependent oxidoreductase [Bacteroidetes bacterium]|nr:FAD-dependent oxidoreductase [Bacteroidota bacterium]MBL6943830.1 FAD-dependent oxidoreductase [Bacteroidales bacterium]